MKISIIVAVSENGGIGFEEGIPWRLGTDMKLFKETTMGHHLIVGRKTYQSIGMPLPGRKMVIVTRQKDYEAAGCDVVHSLQEGLNLAQERGEIECFIGGGAQIYQAALPLTHRMYFTRVLANIEADTFFPQFNEEEWDVIERQTYPRGEDDQYPFSWEIFEKYNQ